jgi:hypothetical protein
VTTGVSQSLDPALEKLEVGAKVKQAEEDNLEPELEPEQGKPQCITFNP